LPIVISSIRGSGSAGSLSLSSGAIFWSTPSSTPFSIAMPTSAEMIDLEADLMLVGSSVVCPSNPFSTSTRPS
jgi:hypothetical protein